MPFVFTAAFVAALALSLTTRLYLALRQARHVAAHRDRVPTGFVDRISLDAHRKAADYTIAKTRFSALALGAETLLLLGLTLGGGIAALHGLWSPRVDGLVYGVAMIFSVTVIAAVVDIPFALYRQFVIEERFGFNRMTPALFVSDLVKSALLGAAVGTPVVLAVLWLMAKMGAYWWIDVWLFWSAFNLLVILVWPTWIAPLFNKFSPLADDALRQRIESLLARCGFRASGLFVMDGSKRSAHGNAYFTGFGRNKRIVFFDTLLARLAPDEIEAVLAHELGHFKRHHIWKRIGLMFALSLGFLALLGQLIDAPWFYAGLGAPTQNTAIGLILFFLVTPVFTFLLTPLSSFLSRQHEYEADAYAAANARSDDLVHALVKLYEDNAATLTPDPLHSLFYDSHPPAALRIARLQAATAVTGSA